MNDREQSLKTEQATPAEEPVSAPSSAPASHKELPDGAMILLPTRNAVLFPGIVAPLTLGRPQSIAAAQTGAQNDKPIGILLQSNPAADAPSADQLHRVGTIGEIMRYCLLYTSPSPRDRTRS